MFGTRYTPMNIPVCISGGKFSAHFQAHTGVSLLVAQGVLRGLGNFSSLPHMPHPSCFFPPVQVVVEPVALLLAWLHSYHRRETRES